MLWNVTRLDSMPTRTCTPYLVSSAGNVCLACAVRRFSDSSGYRTIFFRSADAGRSWIEQEPDLPLESAASINQIDQIDSLHAIAVGDSGLILETYDAGSTWLKIPCPINSNLVDVDCADASSGIIVGLNPSIILIRIESGWSIAPYQISNDDWWVAPTSNRCHAYGSGKYRVSSIYSYVGTVPPSKLYTTEDSWHTVDSVSIPEWTPDSLYNFSITGLTFGDGDTIVASTLPNGQDTYHWVYLRSFDGGKNWQCTPVSTIPQYNLLFLSPISNDDIIAWGDLSDSSSIYANFGDADFWSTDLGATWRSDTFLFDKNLGSPVHGQPGPALGLNRITFTSDGSMVGAFFCYTDSSGSGFLARTSSSFLTSGVNVSPSGSPELILYPNPASSVLNIEFSASPLAILDPLGRSYEVHRTGNTLDISSLPPGVYFISDGVSWTKFVKE